MAERQRRTRDSRLTLRLPEGVEQYLKRHRRGKRATAVLDIVQRHIDEVEGGRRAESAVTVVRLTDEDRQVLDQVAAELSVTGNQARRHGGLINQLAAAANRGHNVDATALAQVESRQADLMARFDHVAALLAGAATWRS